jgi:hypothetical protein
MSQLQSAPILATSFLQIYFDITLKPFGLSSDQILRDFLITVQNRIFIGSFICN